MVLEQIRSELIGKRLCRMGCRMSIGIGIGIGIDSSKESPLVTMVAHDGKLPVIPAPVISV